MNPKEGVIELMVICGVVVLLSLGGIVWDVTSRLLFNGIDGIMLLLVCLTMGGVFSLFMLAIARSAGMLESVKLSQRKAADAPAASPAPAASSSASSSAEPQK
jgi:hypothetical protein